MTARLVLGVLAVTVALVCAAAAQAPGAIVTGQVVSTDAQPQPVRRAIVTISGGTISGNLSVVSDELGRFRFVNLPAARYTLSAQKAGYLKMFYGATRPGRPGTSVAIAAGQTLELRLRLPRGAVITGTVRDQFGQPAAGVQVTVSASSLLSAEAGFRASPDTALTDDRGVYRVFGLMPDEYVVSALPRVTGSADTSRLTRAEFEARARALEMRSGAAPPAADSNGLERVGWAPTFFPGTPVAADAGRIRVETGEERSGVDITLSPVPVARISGVIQSGEIQAQFLRPSLIRVGPPQPLFMSPELTGPGADGRFAFTNVTPGRYSLLVRSGQGALMASADGRSATTNNPGVAAMFAMVDLDIDGRDVAGLTLVLRPALSLSGKVVFDTAATKPPSNLSSIRVALTQSRQAAPTVMNGVALGTGPPPGATVREDGTFEIVGIIPGSYGVSAASKGWWLRSVTLGERDLLDRPLEIGTGSGDSAGVVVTFTDKLTELAGTLTTASGQPASEFTVLMFPADSTLWRSGARRIRTARPATDGAFSILEVPAGDYLLAALTDFGPDDLSQPSFLEQVVPASVKVTIGEGQTVRQDLRIAR